jgi:hypothetical protein
MFSPISNPRPAPPNWREAVRRAVDLTVAFATLESATTARDLWPRGEDSARSGTSPHGPVGIPAPHPHRTPLRAAVRPGRAGTVLAQPQQCLTPHTGRPRRRSAPHIAR